MNYIVVKCNHCENTFFEHKIVYDEDKEKETCPVCNMDGCLMDCINLSEFWKDEVIHEKMVKGEFVDKVLSPLCKYFGYTHAVYTLVFDDKWEMFIGEYVRIYNREWYAFSVNVTGTNKRGILSSVIAALDCGGQTSHCTHMKNKNFVVIKEVI